MTDLVDQMIERTWAEKERAYKIARGGFKNQKWRELNSLTTALLREELRMRDAA